MTGTARVSDCLTRTARELSACTALLARVEDDLAPLLSAAAASPALQGIDLLAQTLADLALWLDALAVQATGRVDLPAALRPLRLANLRTRLIGLPGQTDQPEPLLF